jgi:hypothetical protein
MLESVTDILCKGQAGRKPHVADPDLENGDDKGGGPRVVKCAACDAMVTRVQFRTERDGAHQHTFFNPCGHVFDIRLFDRAPGARVFGQPTGEFTWFPGLPWRYAICGACGVHLGWHWQDDPPFFGFIVGRIYEDDAEE